MSQLLLGVGLVASLGALVAVALHARALGQELRTSQTELQAEQRRSSRRDEELKAACAQHLRTIRAVDILLNDDHTRPEVDPATKRDLGLITTSETWFAGCKDEHEQVTRFLFGTPEERQQQLEAIADEAEQRRLQFENKRFWMLVDGEKVWIEPDPARAALPASR